MYTKATCRPAGENLNRRAGEELDFDTPLNGFMKNIIITLWIYEKYYIILEKI